MNELAGLLRLEQDLVSGANACIAEIDRMLPGFWRAAYDVPESSLFRICPPLDKWENESLSSVGGQAYSILKYASSAELLAETFHKNRIAWRFRDIKDKLRMFIARLVYYLELKEHMYE